MDSCITCLRLPVRYGRGDHRGGNAVVADDAAEFCELGAGTPIPVNAFHNLGVDDLMAEVVSDFSAAPSFLEPVSSEYRHPQKWAPRMPIFT